MSLGKFSLSVQSFISWKLSKIQGCLISAAESKFAYFPSRAVAIGAILSMFSRFLRGQAGNVSMLTAAMSVGIIGLVGGGLDMMNVYSQKADLQAIADNAALSAVREMAITADDAQRISALAVDYVESNNVEAITSIQPQVFLEDSKIVLTIEATPRTHFASAFSNMKPLQVTATAQLSGQGANVCMIGLSPSAMSTIRMRRSAKITADKCAIYSNSTSRESMSVSISADVDADFICVAGGYNGNTDGMENPPVEDCLQIEDPLSARRTPAARECSFENLVITDDQTLEPGTFCGGIEINGGHASLEPGTYIITGGPLIVTNNGTLSGDYVGFYLADEAAKIGFDYEANIDISAPREGVMAGMLIASHPYNKTLETPGLVSGLPVVGGATDAVVDTANNATRLGDGVRPADHTIRSDNARRMVGTIYLPGGKHLIDGRDPIADKSE